MKRVFSSRLWAPIIQQSAPKTERVCQVAWLYGDVPGTRGLQYVNTEGTGVSVVEIFELLRDCMMASHLHSNTGVHLSNHVSRMNRLLVGDARVVF